MLVDVLCVQKRRSDQFLARIGYETKNMARIRKYSLSEKLKPPGKGVAVEKNNGEEPSFFGHFFKIFKIHGEKRSLFRLKMAIFPEP